MKMKKLLRDNSGAAAIEAAFALPVLATMMIGILQFALVFQASGAMRHGLGEGLRFAKVTPGATSTQVLDKTRAGLAGINLDGITALTFQSGTDNGAQFGLISMTYKLEPLLPFAAIPPITLTETRRAYLPS